jgi:hypothetical protein
MKPMQSLTKSEMDCPWLAQLKPYCGLGTFQDYLVNHYALMAMNPKTIEQARWRTQELKKDFPTLGISIANKIQELKNAMP